MLSGEAAGRCTTVNGGSFNARAGRYVTAKPAQEPALTGTATYLERV
ncbi:hypothetical protein LAUMK191_05582 [Mycobacterium attenuatum]|nr:hypothetical protein LAUMK191_05582 [Mycobacterium attenuatum]